MVAREKLINAIRQKGFGFKRETERIELWKQRGSTKRVQLRKGPVLDAKDAAFILKCAGYGDDEIKAFIVECNKLD